MSLISEALLFSLLNQDPSTAIEKLKVFNPSLIKAYEANNASSNFIEDLVKFNPFEYIDASWLIPFFEKIPHYMQQVCLHLISESQAEEVAKTLKIEVKNHTYPSCILRMFQKQLYDYLQLDQVIPLSLIPNSPLMSLVSCSKEKIHDLIDLLAVVELITPIKRIIDRKKLTEIYKVLSPIQKKRLDFCMKRSSRYPPLGMEAQMWIRNPEVLKDKLSDMGLLRLSAALADEPSSLKWYLSHRLDVKSGMFLQQAIEKKYDTKATVRVKHEVSELTKGLSCS